MIVSLSLHVYLWKREKFVKSKVRLRSGYQRLATCDLWKRVKMCIEDVEGREKVCIEDVYNTFQ